LDINSLQMLISANSVNILFGVCIFMIFPTELQKHYNTNHGNYYIIHRKSMNYKFFCISVYNGLPEKKTVFPKSYLTT